MSGRLSVNVDHVATLRQARKASFPEPLAAARIAESAGAHGITVHLRRDRRHIQDDDVRALRLEIEGKLNLEMAVTRELLDLALQLGPDQVTLVPERPDEVTTEGGLDVVAHGGEIAAAAAELAAASIAVSVFLDPEPRQIEELAGLSGGRIAGFELNTDRYSRAGDATRLELDRLAACAALGAETGLHVYAGHGLTTANVGSLAALGTIEEYNIGHAIVSRAVLVGMQRAVEEMLAAIRLGGQGGSRG